MPLPGCQKHASWKSKHAAGQHAVVQPGSCSGPSTIECAAFQVCCWYLPSAQECLGAVCVRSPLFSCIRLFPSGSPLSVDLGALLRQAGPMQCSTLHEMLASLAPEPMETSQPSSVDEPTQQRVLLLPLYLRIPAQQPASSGAQSEPMSPATHPLPDLTSLPADAATDGQDLGADYRDEPDSSWLDMQDLDIQDAPAVPAYVAASPSHAQQGPDTARSPLGQTAACAGQAERPDGACELRRPQVPALQRRGRAYLLDDYGSILDSPHAALHKGESVLCCSDDSMFSSLAFSPCLTLLAARRHLP